MNDRGRLDLTEDQLDFLKELVGLGVGKGSEILSEMLESHIVLTVPSLIQTDLDHLDTELNAFSSEEVSAVDLMFRGSLTGEAKLIFPSESAQILGNILVEADEEEDFDSTKAAALTEIGNIILNSVMGVVSNFFQFQFQYHVPVFHYNFFRGGQRVEGDGTLVLLANTNFQVETRNIEGEIALIFSLESLEVLVSLIDRYLNEDE